LLQKIATSPAVTFALAHGRNFGAGANFFGACKRRIAEPDATFQMPGLNFGLVLGTQRFSACVGRDIAREILSSTRTFDAQEDQVISFITEIAPTETWDTLVETELAQTPAPSRALLHGAIDNDQSDRDLAQLVRSATTPGLKSRIATYLAQAN
jgi:enoyl-CoA hydratase/carnithine racemase